MGQPALSERILMSVEKPARYIGNEINSIKKDPADVRIRFAMCFPDVYEIGMSHLGIQILYEMFNRRSDVWCERVYSPWPDLHRIMKQENIPLFALESQDPVKMFDFLGITLQYEMCYPNILQVLDLSGIPLYASDRSDEDPIVIGGGPCAYNPEPIADFFDLFYIGEGETVYDELLDLYLKERETGYDRNTFLRKASMIEGIYVPSCYDVSYHADGTIRSMQPKYPGTPEMVVKQVVENLSDAVYPEKPLIPFLQITQDRVTLEIMRGCMRGCRFCQAGMIYRPLRIRSLDRLKELAKKMIGSTGYDEISLSSLSSSDYPYLKELLDYLVSEFAGLGVNISLPSLRVDAFSLDVMNKVQDVKKSSLTFAPEAGSQRLRNVINKGLTEDEILHGAALAFEGGWNKVKLYFMLGHPTETREDIEAIALLAEKIAERYYEIPKEHRNGKCQINVSTSFFVPKPFTPFQWMPMCTEEDFLEKAKTTKEAIRNQLNRKSIRYQWHNADVTMIEGVLARGDRKLSAVLYDVYRQGELFSAWSEFFDRRRWEDAFDKTGIDPSFYTTRERPAEEIFPWDFIDAGVRKSFLRKEYETALEGKTTPNCALRCAGCGAMKWQGGICYETEN